nr:MAG TPA: hypothetical protein [Caudoviricetes sp.]
MPYVIQYIRLPNVCQVPQSELSRPGVFPFVISISTR